MRSCGISKQYRKPPQQMPLLIKMQILTIVPTYFFAAYRTPQGANDLDYSLKRHAGKTPNKNHLNIAKNNTVLMIGGQTPEGMLACSYFAGFR